MHHPSRCQAGRYAQCVFGIVCHVQQLYYIRLLFQHFYGSPFNLLFPKLPRVVSLLILFLLTCFLPRLPTLQMWRTWFRVEPQSEIWSARAPHERSSLGRLAQNRVSTERNSSYRPKSRHCARNIYRTCIGNPRIAKLCNVWFARECSHILEEIFRISSAYSDL